MMVIVVGMPGSGKDVFVQTAMAMGFSKVGMGDIVRRFAALSGLDPDDASIGGYADSQRREHGPAIWAERALQGITSGNVIIDGSRSLAEVSLFKERPGNVKVVAVTASPETRFRRLGSRGRRDDPRDRDEFDRRDIRELSWGLGSLIDSADTSLENENSLEVFRTRCRAILEEMLESAD